jgi:small subunit ribosomal protein S16
MAVKIRLKRMGAKKHPIYRIVAIDSRKRRDGQEIERLGLYDPHNQSNNTLDIASVDSWLSKGAIPTETVKNLISKSKQAV